jgi:hypothetical protein
LLSARSVHAAVIGREMHKCQTGIELEAAKCREILCQLGVLGKQVFDALTDLRVRNHGHPTSRRGDAFPDGVAAATVSSKLPRYTYL